MITRRRMFAGAAAAALAPLTASSIWADTKVTSNQAPGFFRSRVGEIEVTIVSDGARARPIYEGLARNASKSELVAAAEAAFMPKDQFMSYFTPVVVNTGNRLILIDTGFGPKIGPTVGLLPDTLASAGIDPLAIDLVLITHMHGDHTQGLRTATGELAFPNAEIKVPAQDWLFWMNDDNMSRASDPNKFAAAFTKSTFESNRKVFAATGDRVATYQWGQEVASGVTAMETGGHTPGHSSFMISSGSNQLLVLGDVTNVPALFLRNPHWQIIFDLDPERAAQTRRRTLDMAAADKLRVSGYHFPFPSLGYVEKDGSGYRLVPSAWTPWA
jgi:glyoxylase-like metal-dependent hydrolase (beta-lactamase superfamily II)